MHNDPHFFFLIGPSRETNKKKVHVSNAQLHVLTPLQQSKSLITAFEWKAMSTQILLLKVKHSTYKVKRTLQVYYLVDV